METKINEFKRLEEKISRMERLYETIIRISQMQDISLNEIMDYALETTIAITDSKIGYILFYDEETKLFNIYSWSKEIMAECRVINQQTVYTLEETGLWGEAVRQRKPMITNDYQAENPYKKGIPKGHIEIIRHMNVPVFYDNKIVAVVGVGNKDTNYNETDVQHLSLLMSEVWKTTMRWKLEGELKDSEERFRSTFEQAAVGIEHADLDGKFIRVNKKFCDILGYTKEEMLNINFQDITYPEDLEVDLQFVDQLLARKINHFTLEKRYIKKDASVVWINLTLSLMLDLAGSPKYFIGVIEDISKRKEIEEKIEKYQNNLQALVEKRTAQLQASEEKQREQYICMKKAKEDAEKADRVKGEFIANMSHEMRTPLNAVIGFSELISSRINDKKLKSYIESINIAGKGLLHLINDILDLSKIEAGMMEIRYEPINIISILNEIVQIFTHDIKEKELKFIIDIDKKLPSTLILDEIRLRQVLLNIVGNAVKFTEKGSIKLSVKKISKIENHQSTLDLIISVEDTGIGIRADEQERIFESFRQQSGQNNRKYGGTGLGLAICKKLIEIMKGDITLQSKVGVGSTFTIILYDVRVLSLEPLLERAKYEIYATEMLDRDNLLIDIEPENQVYYDIENRSEFVSRVQDEIFPMVQALSGVVKMAKVNQLAERITELGLTYKVSEFCSYGEKLHELASRFDIKNINKMLIKLMGIVESLKKME